MKFMIHKELALTKMLAILRTKKEIMDNKPEENN
jgi:hypothetical protein